MGNTHWGLGIPLVFICILLVMMPSKCMGYGNLTTAACSKQERLALLKFKQSVKDVHDILKTWVGDDCCSWERVRCDDATGRVVSLNLRKHVREDKFLDDHGKGLFAYYIVYDKKDHYLVGDEVNSCLAELVNLKYLDLSGNDFKKSQVPEFIGSLKQLRYLNLSHANLSHVGFYGLISHQIGNLSNLKVLDLSGMNFSTTQNLNNILYMIPSLLNLRLSKCGLSMAHFGSHHLNSSRRLASIRQLDLSGNGFRGQLPSLFFNMTSLVFLDLSCDNFSHPVSMSWSFENLLNMTPSVSELHLAECNIQKIHLSSTNFSFTTRSKIQVLDLSRNDIEGKFPSLLTYMSSLLSLDLSYNSLNSSIPVMPNLFRLDITANKFSQIEDVGIWRQCHLKELVCSSNQLKGEMVGPPTNVSKCSQNALEILYLDNNALSGLIPKSIGTLTNLRRLDLSYNKLTGPIPRAVGKLTSLRSLFLNSNGFTGPIPASLGRLTSLKVLSLSSNFLNGTISNSIGKLTKLYLLDVSNNSLKGVISAHLFDNLSLLKYLNANANANANYSNKLSCKFSPEWMPPFQLKTLRLGSCKIADGFPQWLETQGKLEVLVLSNTNISGPLPKWLNSKPMMRVLDLSHNKLIGSLTNLPCSNDGVYALGGKLLLQDNLFKGLIPKWLCKWTDLEVLNLSRNNLTGKIPNCLWNMSLYVMQLGSNRLSGVIPPSYLIIVNPNLIWLQLNDNKLNGELPREVGYFINLQFLDLGENNISGNIPEWIGENMTGLMALRLRKNNFTGIIPHSICKAQQLKIIELANNNLNGRIPRCFGDLEGMKNKRISSYYWYSFYFGNMMQVLKGQVLNYTTTLEFVRNMDLSSNKLVGEVPEALMTLDALLGLNLSFNHFTGSIPENLGNMTSLISLDLSTNEFSGMIPHSMADLYSLSCLNLSHNNLSGQIPTGRQLQTLLDPSIYDNNTYLCGAPLPKECARHENKHENGYESKKVLFYLDIMSGFATGFGGIVGVLIFKKQWRHKLYMFCKESINKIYVAITVRVLKMKRAFK